MNRISLIIPAFILAASLAISSLIISRTWRAQGSVLRVTGSAKQRIQSDLAILRLTVSASADSRMAALADLEGQLPKVLVFLKKHGVGDREVELSPAQIETVWEYDGRGYRTGRTLLEVYRQTLTITLADVFKIKELSLLASALAKDGVNIEVAQPEYLFTDLASVKVAIQALAAKDARERAKGISDATGATLGVLRDARMGVIQITPENSTMVSDYGTNDTSSIGKEVTAVVSATFEIS